MTKEYIKKHYMEDIQVDQMAARLYMSPGYLSMVFKKEVGENIKQYIRNVRMEKAEELLTSHRCPCVKLESIQDLKTHPTSPNVSGSSLGIPRELPEDKNRVIKQYLP